MPGGVAFVSLRGIVIEYQRRGGIYIVGGRNISVDGVTVANVGQLGVLIDGQDIVARGLHVQGAGCGGVALSGGDYKSLRPSGIRLQHSSIENYARVRRTYTPGVSWWGVGHYVGGNVVHRAPHAGILGFGNDGVFENNIFRDLAFEATDTGAWYSGRSWVRRGHVIQGNLFERVRNTDIMALGYSCVMGIYLDDMLAGITIVNNTFRDVQVGIFVGGSRDISIVANNFERVLDASIRIEPIGLTWRADACRFNGSEDNAGILPRQLWQVGFLAAPYAAAYPTLPAILHRKPCAPVDLRILGNLFRVVAPVHIFGPGSIDTPSIVIEEPLNTIADNRNASTAAGP